MNATVEDRPEEPAATAAEPGGDAAEAPFAEMFGAGIHLVNALRHVATGFRMLVTAEAKLLRASIGVIVLCAVALIAGVVSLWACAVALIAWGLTLATGSIGIALAILIVLHGVLMTGLWFMIKRAIHRATFPRTREEIGVLGRELRADARRFQRASAGTGPGARS